MTDKHTDSSYKHSHKKSAKSFAKIPCEALDIKPHIGTKFTASRLHGFTAKGTLCLNKTITIIAKTVILTLIRGTGRSFAFL